MKDIPSSKLSVSSEKENHYKDTENSTATPASQLSFVRQYHSLLILFHKHRTIKLIEFYQMCLYPRLPDYHTLNSVKVEI